MEIPEDLTLRSLELQPGKQTLVYTTSERLSAEQHVAIRSWYAKQFPENLVVVVDHGASLSILGENEQLTRIEQKLDHLIQALVEDEEPAPSLTLDGQQSGGERDQDQPL